MPGRDILFTDDEFRAIRWKLVPEQFKYHVITQGGYSIYMASEPWIENSSWRSNGGAVHSYSMDPVYNSTLNKFWKTSLVKWPDND